MKTLYLIRHAKSEWANESITDIDRPLNSRGYTDAHTMSKLLKEKGIKPDAIITSPAIRAVSTALIFSRNLKLDDSTIIIEPTLYEPFGDQYKKIIALTDNKHHSLMLFGHNPYIEHLAMNYSFSEIKTYPTCCIAGFTFDADDWKTAVGMDAKLVLFDFPKNHF